MIRDAHEFDLNLATACGGDAALRQELFASFRESLEHHIDLLGRARCDGNWRVAAQRLRGLGSSFHASALVELSEQALDGAPGDPFVMRRLRELAAGFAARG